MKLRLIFEVALLVCLSVVAVAQNVPNMRLAEGSIFVGNATNISKPVALGTAVTSYAALLRGYMWRGASTGLATAFDANDSGKVLVGDGTDLTSLSINTAANKYLAAPATRRLLVDMTTEPAPLFQAHQGNTTVCNGDDNDICAIQMRDVMGRTVYAEMIYTGAHGTALFTKATSAPHGWVWPQDGTDTESAELTLGIIDTGGTKYSFLTGTDAFYIKAKFAVADISQIDVLAVGFRKIAAYAAGVTTGTGHGAGTLLDQYDDEAYLAVHDAVGALFALTEAGGTENEDALSSPVAWVDAGAHTFEVYVATNRTVTMKVDGAAVGGMTDFALDNAVYVIPSIIITQQAAAPGVVWQSFEVGDQ